MTRAKDRRRNRTAFLWWQLCATGSLLGEARRRRQYAGRAAEVAELEREYADVLRLIRERQ